MNFIKIFLTLLVGIVLLSTNALALVDYSSPVDSEARSKTPRRKIKINKRPSNSVQATSSPSRASSRSLGVFELRTSYLSQNIEVGNRTGKVDSWAFEGQFQTSYGVYLVANHYMASSKSLDLTSKSENQQGNPSVKIGFNWLRFGGGADAGSVDILVGASFGQGNSDFATSRTDKIFGIETTKRMGVMVLGIGYEFKVTGTPGTEEELDIGNIQKMYAVLGWMATGDIRFSFEAGTYKVNLGDGNYGLDKKTSFGYVAPELHLALSPSVSLDLGAIFRTKRLGNEDLIDARLYDLKGAYGSSILAGLSLAL